MRLLNFSRMIRKSTFVRILIFPFVIVWQWSSRVKYYRSEDYKFIQSFKNKYIGQRCFIVGNGPSLKGEDLDMIGDEISFGFNRIYNIFKKTTWRPTFYMCSDGEVLWEEDKSIRALQGSVKFVNIQLNLKPIRYNPEDNIHLFLTRDRYSFRKCSYMKRSISRDCARGFTRGESIVHRALEFAIYMGIKEIYLLGIDNNYPISIDKKGEKSVDYSIKDHFTGGGSKDKRLNYIYIDAMNQCYRVFRDYANSNDIKIYNATRGGKLEIFERADFDSLF